jgi:tetratricopeptide (TPR) repeat protein
MPMAGDRPQRPDASRSDVGNVEGTASIGGDVHQQAKYLAGHTLNLTVQEATTAPPPAARLQLPPDVGDFTGRTGELSQLQELLDRARTQNPTATPMLLVNGMPGVGKSALVLHLAHLLRDHYPGAQLYVRLSAIGEPTVTAAEALDSFLRALGVRPEQLPATFQGRVDLYRTLLAEQRALVVLDNAMDREQIEPLRPASGGCLALVTSRSDLPGMDGVMRHRLQPMVAEEGVQLLGRLVGPERVAADQRGAERVVELCGGLPLAIRLAGASLTTTATRNLPVEKLVERLTGAHQRLDELADEADERQAVRASFDLSYQVLPVELAGAFRYMSLLQVPDVAAEVVASLVGIEQVEAEWRLRALVNAQLVEAVGPTGERYTLHDLLALYSAELVETDSPEDRQAALQRALAWYLQQTERMSRLLTPTPVDIDEFTRGASELADQAPTDPAGIRAALIQQALDWLEVERPSLVAVQRQAAHLGDHITVWRLADSLTEFFSWRKHWGDWQITHELALQAVRELDDRKAQARILDSLGTAFGQQQRSEEAIACFEQSLAICRDLDDRSGEGYALGHLGIVYSQQQRFAEATRCFEHSITIFEELGDRIGQGKSLNNLALAYLREERPTEAISPLESNLDLFRDLGDRYLEAQALANLGLALAMRLRLKEAAGYLEESLEIRRDLRDRFGQAQSLAIVGSVYALQGDMGRATQFLTEAQAIFAELQAPEAEKAVADLERLRKRRLLVKLFSLFTGSRRQ